MKKLLTMMTMLLMVSALSFVVTSCGDDDDDEKIEEISIIGTWTHVEHDGSYSFSEKITFKSDGTFKLVWQELSYSGDESGTWEYDTNDHKLTLTTIVGEKPGSCTFTVILQGNQMTLIEPDGDVKGPYTKQ